MCIEEIQRNKTREKEFERNSLDVDIILCSEMNEPVHRFMSLSSFCAKTEVNKMNKIS